MGQRIADEGVFIEDLENGFNELVLNGTYKDEEMGLMRESTFTEWAERVAKEAEKTGIAVNFTVHNVSINQTDPWYISVDANINMTIRDKKNTSSWKKTEHVITEVGIENFEDPLYVVKSIGKVTNVIVRSPITDFVDGNDPSNLVKHLNNSYYIESNVSPNFLMRLQGDLSNSSTGIESLVNLKEFQEQGVTIKDRSAVDYIYFGTETTTNYRINKTYEWFKLDEYHLKIYEAEDIICEAGDVCVESES